MSSNHVTVMPKKLAQALMEAGMKHFDAGGGVQPNQGNAVQYGQTTQGSGQIATAPPPSSGQSANNAVNGFGSFLQNEYTTPWNYQGMTQGLADTATGAMGMLGLNAPQSQFQAQAPNIGVQNLGPRLANNQAQQQATYNNQYNLAQALLGQSQGQGPNPAQAQLAQNTANNVNTQGALMASQRGASANPALIARQAAMQGAATQQGSVGQAATLQAQQQLGAQQALMQQQQNMQNAALQSESIGQGAQAAQNTAITQGQLGAQNINSQTANQNRDAQGNFLGGAMQGIGAAAAALLSKGGEVQKMSDGGLMGIQHYDSPSVSPPSEGHIDSGGMGKGMSGLGGALGGMFSSLLSKGGGVPGKAEKKGNNDENDKVPALLSPGEIVLPRSVTMGKNVEKKAIEFLRHLKAGKKGFNDVVEARHTKMMCNGGRMYK